MKTSSIELVKKGQQDSSLLLPDSSPLLSVIVPVFNGSKNIESTLQKLGSKMDQLKSAAFELDNQSLQKEKPSMNTGRKVVENAGAGLLLDEYLSKYSPSGNDFSVGLLESIAHGTATNNENIDHRRHQDDENAPTQIETVHDPLNIAPWYELVVVNDGSKDNTRQVVESITKADGRIRLISYSINMGKGYAIKQGVLHSRGRYILFMDGDGEISTDVLAEYLKNLKNADIVIGSKNHPSSIVKVPASRKILSKCFQLFVRMSLGIKVRDTQVGLKAGRGDSFRKIFQRVLVKRYAFDAEMLAIATILHLKILELPVKIDLDKSFKKKEIARMAIDVLGVAFRLRLIKWYQKNMERKRPGYHLLPFV